MKRSIFLLLASVASVSFLILQWVFLEEINEGSSQRSQSLASLQTILKVLRRHYVVSFAIDHELLNYAEHAQERPSRGECVLCRYKVITLAAMETTWRTEVLQDLRNAGLTVKEFTSVDPCLNTVDKIIMTHIPMVYEITTSTTHIRVVMVYKRNSYYWWRDMLNSYSGVFQSVPSVKRFKVDGVDLPVPRNIKSFVTELSQSKFIECDIKKARQFQSSYSTDNSPEAIHFKTQALEVLSLAVSILKQLKIRFWLSSGTCLGWFRECGIIAHSKDVDLGIFIKDYKPELIETFRRHGLYLKHVFGKVEDSFELSFRTVKGDVKLDIFFFYEENDYMWNGGTRARTGEKYKYIFPKFTLCWSELLGVLIRVPCETLSYIEANYGKEWYKPIKEWKWNESPPNVRRNGKWDEKDWPDVIQLYEIY